MGAGTEVGFYHLTRSALEPALGRLLERVLDSGLRAVVRASSAERAEALNRALWQFGRDSFLPHGTRADGSAEDQPVFLTEREDYPNGAQRAGPGRWRRGRPGRRSAAASICSTAMTIRRSSAPAICGGAGASAAWR